MRVGEDLLGWILSFLSAVVYNLGNGGRGALCHLFNSVPNLWAALWLTQMQAVDTDFPGPAVLVRTSEALSAQTLAALQCQGKWQKAEISTSALQKQVTAKSPVLGITKGAQATDLTGVITEPILCKSLFHTISK